VSPSPAPSGYSGKPTAQKLGIKTGMRVCLVSAPRGFAAALTPRAERVAFTAKISADCDLFVVFVRSRSELVARAVSLARNVTRQTVWFAWPKKASGVTTDIDGNVVRETGLATGWVDFKVCAVDETWSGLAFKRRQVGTSKSSGSSG
jgi:hypothetical protein